MAEYQGVNVEHPRIVEAIRTMVKRGESKERIAKIVGMPYEVVDKHVQEAKKKG